MKTGARARITRLYRAPVRRVHSQVGPRHAFAGGVLLALVAGGLFFQDLGRYPLWDPDEARHAEIAREMAAAHGWRRLVLPTFELAPYREKPPGHYWLVSLAYTALGVGAGAARTPGAVAAWLLVMVLYAWTLPRAGVAGAPGGGPVPPPRAGRARPPRRADPPPAPPTLRGLAATNVRRLSAASPHAAPVWYYALWLPILFLPWTLLAPMALVHAARDPDRRALVAWAAFVPLVLTLAAGKLATYVLPALPALALVVGPELARVVARHPEATRTRVPQLSGWLGVLLLGVAAAAAAVAARSYPVPALGRAAFAAAALAWALALAIALSGHRQHAVPLALLGAVLTLHPVFVRFAAPAVSALHSDHAMAQLLAQAGPAPVIAFGSQAPSLVFYLGTPVVHTEDPRLVRDLFEADA